MINKICVYSDVGAWRLSGDLESDLERKLRRGGREDRKKEGVKERFTSPMGTFWPQILPNKLHHLVE